MAVVVGSGLNALGVVRSLAKGRVPVRLLYSEPDAAGYSRHADKTWIAGTAGDALADALRAIGEREAERPVLFLTEERSVETVSERRNEILPGFRATFAGRETLATLMHKQGFQATALGLGSPVPPAVHLRSEADLPALAGLRYPCVLKPAVKDYVYGARFQKAYVVGSAEEAGSRYREIAPTLADLVVQEWIEGTDSDIYFCLQYIGADGAIVASFAGRKIRSWPPHIGGTASCTAAYEHLDELTALTGRFFRQTGFVGMGSMEYKRDARDGRFYMVEPTVGRTDFQEEVATVHGTNIPLAAYCHEAGLPPPVVAPAACKLWREPVTDRWSAQLQPTLPGLPGAAAIDAYWRWDDPLPWLHMVAGRIKSRLR